MMFQKWRIIIERGGNMVAYLNKIRNILFIFFALFFMQGTVFAVPPDFNADRRVNIRCPATISDNGEFETDGLMSTLKRLYHELDDNLKVSARAGEEGETESGYAFSSDPNGGIFFIAHAKASFPPGSLYSLYPSERIQFQEIFYITEIDWDKLELQIVRQRDKQLFKINVPDFEKGFLWYNALLDKDRAYIPVYGFLSLPGEADEFPTIWDSWEAHRQDTATPPESLVDYDFYKVLDYKDGYYLLAEDFYEFDYRGNVEDYGIVGWVEKDYITLWRSRLYYHPMRSVNFYNDSKALTEAKEGEEINRFYVDHVYLKERLFSDIVERLDQESLHRFYTHFGFPQLGDPEYTDNRTIAKVFIPGSFTPRLMRLLNRSMKRNLNTFFLLDVSESMRPFADYVKTFNRSVSEMSEEGIALRMNRIYTYRDSFDSFSDIEATPVFTRIKRPEELVFAHKSGDKNYAEPLMRSFTKVLEEIESLQEEGLILPLHEKLLFIITDAGANDFTDEAFARTVEKAKGLNLHVYLIHPNNSGVRTLNPNIYDSPSEAFDNLIDLISAYEEKNPKEGDITFREFEFSAVNLSSEERRDKDFSQQHKDLLGAIQTYMNRLFMADEPEGFPKDVLLYFSDERLLTEMRKWSDRRIQVLNHVTKYIESVDDPRIWEERIAIPAKPVESFLREIRTQDDVSLSDLKKLVIINSLVSVDDIEKARKLYDHIKPLIEKKTFKSSDDVFYKALTRRDPQDNTTWNKSLGEESGPLGGYLAERGFHLNSFNQAVQRKFMYIKVNELYSISE